MKTRKINRWILLISFLSGAFICYILTQFQYFIINYELDIPDIILSIITALIGIYIAITIQKNLNKNQNQYSYLIDKLDILWTSFNDFSKTFVYDDKIEANGISRLTKEIIHPVEFIKILFNSFKIKDDCVNSLESQLEELETIINDIPPQDNIIYFDKSKKEIDEIIAKINQSFSIILKTIQDI